MLSTDGLGPPAGQTTPALTAVFAGLEWSARGAWWRVPNPSRTPVSNRAGARAATPGRVLEPTSMVPEKYRLSAVGRFLLEQFELRRPGIREWTPQLEAALRQDAEGELQLME